MTIDQPNEPRPRPGGRSARVVSAVLEAALELFAEHGYDGLSIEEVASRAGVNKTTVYRRWSTKAELLRAAFHRVRDAEPEPPDTGSIRDDLLVLLRARAAKMSTPRGRSVAISLLKGSGDGELGALLAELKRERPTVPAVVFERAIERGELPEDLDAGFFSEALMGTLYGRILWSAAPFDDRHLERLIDLCVRGAAAGAATRPRHAAASPSRPR